ncbi:hypothetical protein EIN_169060 [Entamoeba invadens IP1]|uniref:Uncharacterized protein n=1 Tax=Entamoeba invadens IP1 TaxID=370355 RepID=A0A0A1TVQ0_ENTIV|nr:hypothetical protein EIN_169060 [Entamoeba invadens IP1]ELP84491.1 hypothetical protein EIN_169060 [Entamoeba invadens IP1]|eukprot:XP_004183837.1 hypothetical protein EIN_169060 [Entamoeba invadens IP1]
MIYLLTLFTLTLSFELPVQQQISNTFPTVWEDFGILRCDKSCELDGQVMELKTEEEGLYYIKVGELFTSFPISSGKDKNIGGVLYISLGLDNVENIGIDKNTTSNTITVQTITGKPFPTTKLEKRPPVEEEKSFFRKYWPWLLGAGVLFFFLSK